MYSQLGCTMVSFCQRDLLSYDVDIGKFKARSHVGFRKNQQNDV